METRPAVWESREEMESSAAHARGFPTREAMLAHYETRDAGPATEDDYRRRMLTIKRIANV
jgi:hypothetical protein